MKNIIVTLTPLDNIRKDSNRLINPSNTFTKIFNENDIVDTRIEYEMVYRQPWHDFPSRERKDIDIKASELKKGDELKIGNIKLRILIPMEEFKNGKTKM